MQIAASKFSSKKSMQQSAVQLLAVTILLALMSFAQAEEIAKPKSLNTQISKTQIQLPAGSLSETLPTYAAEMGVNLVFDTKLTQGKTSKPLKGQFNVQEGFNELLKDTLLEVVPDNKGGYLLKYAPPKQNVTAPKPIDIALDKVQVRAKRFYEVGPMPGLALTKEEIPGNVQSITAKEIKESHALSLTDLMNSKLQSVTVNDYQSNPFQMDVQYRGFTASPQLGTAQGISVFLDGIRVNEPFGDVVNWDMLPLNALAGLDVFPGSNPIFGLGTLGGALAMRTKSGFNEPGLDMEVLTGSFGRKQLQVSAGGNNGVIAGFAAGTFFMEDGWRDDSPSKVNQLFGKAEWQNNRARLGLSMLYAGNKLTGNGLLPEQMVDQNPKQVYTSPDKSKNDLLQFQLSGIWDVTDTFNITGQVYKRKSNRKTSTADVNENFGARDARPAQATVRDRNRQLLLGLPDVNRDGLPDYNNYAMNVAADAAGNPLTNSGAICDVFIDPTCVNDLAIGTQFAPRYSNGVLQPINANQAIVSAQDGSGTDVLNWTFDPRINLDAQDNFQKKSIIPDAFNAPVTAQYEQYVRNIFNDRGRVFVNQGGPLLYSLTTHPGGGNPIFAYDLYVSAPGGVLGGYTDDGGFYHAYTELFEPINSANLIYPISNLQGLTYGGTFTPVVSSGDGTANAILRDGSNGEYAQGPQTGYIEGTPTAIFTDTQIQQDGIGGALQLNWNLENHKFMLGVSMDKSDSIYDSKQYLGLLDDRRHGFVAPELLGWEYFANSPERGVGLNDFSGDSVTKSIYASETWSPRKNLNITASARFNHTVVRNQLAVTNISRFADVNDIYNFLTYNVLCPDNNNDGVVDPITECPFGLDSNIIPFDPNLTVMLDGLPGGDGQRAGNLRPPESEKFKYRSFNPSLGVTWQASEDLNLYGNIGRGARAPTVIELGCALDPTPIDGKPRSLAEQRTCTLPGALSGDPFLKQVRSTSVEMGARGKLTNDIEWNASVYHTDLTDDIYFVGLNATDSFFQNVGDTRRRGIEMGMKGRVGKSNFGVNYSLTDATFQTNFNVASPNNSSADPRVILVGGGVGASGQPIDVLNPEYQQIKVKPGNRLPGIPLHNLNFNFAYDFSDKWTIGLNAIMHSSAFVRGNENNQHKAGPAVPLETLCPAIPANAGKDVCPIARANFREGKTPGYTVVNFQTSYKFTPEWTLGMQINNLFDKQYASAGRLGLNAFSPSIRGVIGAGGFNYNSADWQGASFLGIGAPRSAFFTLSYQFAADKKSYISEEHEGISVDIPLPNNPLIK